MDLHGGGVRQVVVSQAATRTFDVASDGVLGDGADQDERWGRVRGQAVERDRRGMDRVSGHLLTPAAAITVEKTLKRDAGASRFAATCRPAWPLPQT